RRVRTAARACTSASLSSAAPDGEADSAGRPARSSGIAPARSARDEAPSKRWAATPAPQPPTTSASSASTTRVGFDIFRTLSTPSARTAFSLPSVYCPSRGKAVVREPGLVDVLGEGRAAALQRDGLSLAVLLAAATGAAQ